MGSLPRSVNYDFPAARARQEEYKRQYRLAKRLGDEDTCLIFEALYDEIDREIAEAHQSTNAKMTTVRSSGHPVVHIENVITPIIPAWGGDVKAVMENG